MAGRAHLGDHLATGGRRVVESARHRGRRFARQTAQALRNAPYRIRTGYNPTGERVCPDFPDANFESHLRVYEFASQFVPGNAVLDIGCGTGYGTALLAARGARVALGVDRARDAIRYARRSYGGRAAFRVMDAQRLTLDDASFDVAISSENLEHLPDPRAGIREARRVLGAHGLLVLGTPNKEMTSPGKERSSNRFHEKEFYYAELRDLLGEFFATTVIFENTGESASELGRRLRAERAARGELGLEVDARPSVTIGGLVIDVRSLQNTHSFVALATDSWPVARPPSSPVV